MKILVTGAFPITEYEREQLKSAGHEVFFQQYESERTASPERYEAVICNALFQSNDIERFSSLRLIQLTSAGLDRVPLDYIRTHSIELHNASGVYSVPMAEFAIGGILQLYKGSRGFMRSQCSHRWTKQRNLLELYGRSVCVVGTGHLGREISVRLKAFGCRIVGVNRTLRPAYGFDEILSLEKLRDASSKADVLICCLALTEETKGLFDRDIFESLPKNAVFVNVSRGALVIEADLIGWLRTDRALGAVLDVFENEPLPPDSPLWDMENVILTPHNSFVGDGNHVRLWEQVIHTLNG